MSVNVEKYAVIELAELKWPEELQIPATHFRLLVAADVVNVSWEVMFEFARSALIRGMTYFCAWGADCGRFHDAVDEVIVEDEIGERRFVLPSSEDFVMTTFHENENLEDALYFLTSLAYPTDGLAPHSEFRLVICVGNSDWARLSHEYMKNSDFFV